MLPEDRGKRLASPTDAYGLDPLFGHAYPLAVHTKSEPRSPLVVRALRAVGAAARFLREGRHPLGPLWGIKTADRPTIARLWAVAVVVAGLGVGAFAASLQPDPTGMGTHRQLGAAPCLGPALLGYPCPTCGMTTAMAHAVRGEFLSSFRAQPAGLMLAVAMAAAVSVSISTIITGKVWRVNWYRVSPVWIAPAIVTVVLGGWVYKVASGMLSGTLPISG